MVDNNIANSNSVPKLGVSRGDAEKKIALQIERGHAISSLLGNPDFFSRGEVKASAWHQQSTELLSLLFVDATLSMEFSEISGGSWDAYMAKAIAKLETILDRIQLGLIPESAKTYSNPLPITSFSGKNIFIVHGHNEATKESVARFVEKIGLTAIILHEQPNAGRTIIEKFEDHSDVGFAIVLLTPDDIGASQDKKDQTQPRARQNVILELGYFMGKLGRGRVCALYKEGVEIPSDYQGVLYIPMDSGGAWRMALAKEIKNAGIEVDLNKL